MDALLLFLCAIVLQQAGMQLDNLKRAIFNVQLLHERSDQSFQDNRIPAGGVQLARQAE
jgi:hypothetical protein